MTVVIMRQLVGAENSASVGDPALELLIRHPEGLTASDVAESLHLHVTTVRVHLNRLVAEGKLLQRDERAGVGRPRRRYFPVPRAVPAIALQDDYQLLAEVLAQVLDVERAKAEEVLREWAMRTLDAALLGIPTISGASWQEKVSVVIDLLRAWGYDPQVTETGPWSAAVDLRSCPLRQAAFSSPEAVCGAHRGLIRGALGVLGEPDTGVELNSDFSGGPCCLRLSRATGNQGEKK